MSSGGEDLHSVSTSKSEDEVRKWSMKTYTRDFLLSLALLDVCKTVPNGFDPSAFFLERGDASGGPSQSCPSSDTSKLGSISREEWLSTGAGLLGVFAPPTITEDVDGTSASQVPEDGNQLLNKSPTPYCPPHLWKVQNRSRKQKNGFHNDETFGSSNLAYPERVNSERRKRDSFESTTVRYDEQTSFYEKQKRLSGHHKENMDPDVTLKCYASEESNTPPAPVEANDMHPSAAKPSTATRIEPKPTDAFPLTEHLDTKAGVARSSALHLSNRFIEEGDVTCESPYRCVLSNVNDTCLNPHQSLQMLEPKEDVHPNNPENDCTDSSKERSVILGNKCVHEVTSETRELQAGEQEERECRTTKISLPEAVLSSDSSECDSFDEICLPDEDSLFTFHDWNNGNQSASVVTPKKIVFGDFYEKELSSDEICLPNEDILFTPDRILTEADLITSKLAAYSLSCCDESPTEPNLNDLASCYDKYDTVRAQVSHSQPCHSQAFREMQFFYPPKPQKSGTSCSVKSKGLRHDPYDYKTPAYQCSTNTSHYPFQQPLVPTGIIHPLVCNLTPPKTLNELPTVPVVALPHQLTSRMQLPCNSAPTKPNNGLPTVPVVALPQHLASQMQQYCIENQHYLVNSHNPIHGYGVFHLPGYKFGMISNQTGIKRAQYYSKR